MILRIEYIISLELVVTSPSFVGHEHADTNEILCSMHWFYFMRVRVGVVFGYHITFLATSSNVLSLNSSQTNRRPFIISGYD
jgi:hypothetical protein